MLPTLAEHGTPNELSPVMSNLLANRIARALRSYGFAAYVTGGQAGQGNNGAIHTDASDADVQWVTLECIMGGK